MAGASSTNPNQSVLEFDGFLATYEAALAEERALVDELQPQIVEQRQIAREAEAASSELSQRISAKNSQTRAVAGTGQVLAKQLAWEDLPESRSLAAAILAKGYTAESAIIGSKNVAYLACEVDYLGNSEPVMRVERPVGVNNASTMTVGRVTSYSVKPTGHEDVRIKLNLDPNASTINVNATTHPLAAAPPTPISFPTNVVEPVLSLGSADLIRDSYDPNRINVNRGNRSMFANDHDAPEFHSGVIIGQAAISEFFNNLLRDFGRYAEKAPVHENQVLAVWLCITQAGVDCSLPDELRDAWAISAESSLEELANRIFTGEISIPEQGLWPALVQIYLGLGGRPEEVESYVLRALRSDLNK